VVGAPGGLPAGALEVRLRAARFGGQPSHVAESEGWAHFEFTRINRPTILPKKIEELMEVRSVSYVRNESGPSLHAPAISP
jgi:hypothetical protein